ncbi:MAG: hypothetical protein IT210_03535 [Armatimonadetes bacterium]|nr:hypothetical protein [Armatimonadota bacterium]
MFPLIWIAMGKPQGAVARFIDFALSPEGQKIVKEIGYVALKGEGK